MTSRARARDISQTKATLAHNGILLLRLPPQRASPLRHGFFSLPPAPPSPLCRGSQQSLAAAINFVFARTEKRELPLSLGCANSCAFSFTPRIPTVLAFAGPPPSSVFCAHLYLQPVSQSDPDLASSNQPAQLDHVCLTKCTFCISMTSVHIFIHSQYPRAQGRGAANQPAPACLWSAPPWSGSPAPHTPPRTLPHFPAAEPAAART